MRTIRSLLVIGQMAVLAGVAASGAEVVISEFMAYNNSFQTDDNGQYSDWIELHNVSSTNVNLLNWSLTDNRNNPGKWQFPATNIGPGQLMIVYASGDNRRIPGLPLHTSFKLASSGGYLALYRPDGQVATQFDPYPQQFPDVSYGFGLSQTGLNLVSSNALVRVHVPSSGVLGTNWIQTGFDDSGWLSGTNGVGYDTGSLNPGEDLMDSTVLSTRPALFFRLNETSGPSAANVGTNTAVSGTYQGSIQQGQAGPRPPTYGGFEANNYAPRFDGSSAYVGCPGILNNMPAFSMAGWVQIGTTTFNRTGLFGQNDAIEFGFINNTTVQIWTPGGGSLNVTHNFQIGEWHHIAVVGDGSNLRIYFDGVLQGTGGTPTSSYGSSSYGFNIGGGGVFDATGNFFNGLIDEVAVWTRALSQAEITQIYQASLSGGSGISYTNLIRTDLRTAMLNNNSSAYIRFPFVLQDPSLVNRLTLRMKYDDGFVAYLNGQFVAARNAPAIPAWNSTATTFHSDGQAVEFEDFNLSSSLGYLVPGTNVLAIHGLNTSSTNSDFLILAQLEGINYGDYASEPRYFVQPTFGSGNGVGVADLGPIISAVGSSVDGRQPVAGQSITVTARVSQAFATVTNVTLNWRVMFGTTNTVTMRDDGASGDGAAGDGIYGATFSPGASAGQMIRWFVTAQDANGRTSRWPLFEDPLDSEEYLGTVVYDPGLTSSIPIIQLFVSSTEQPKIDTESGGRVSVFYDGEFYDNVYMELRGNTTAGYVKKSHHLEFNRGHKFRHLPGYPRVRQTSFIAEYIDPAYLRQYMSFWLMDKMGVPSPYDYPVRLQLNGSFYQLAFHNDTLGAEQVKRLGFDERGALYKAAGTIQPNYFSTGGFQKKTRLNEDRSDYLQLANGISETQQLATRRINVFDMMDVPEVVNYLATARFIQEADDVWANMSIYRDSEGDGLWRIIPFDLNLSWGQCYYGNSADYAVVNATLDNHKAHPLYGGSTCLPAESGNYNRIYDVIIQVPETRQMLLRRLRTLLDDWVKPPGTDPALSPVESHIKYMTNLLFTEAYRDRATWGIPANGGPYGLGPNQMPDIGWNQLLTLFLYPRRTHLYVTHSITNTSRPIGINNASNAGIPLEQPTNATLAIIDWDFNPTSGNQAQEYVCLTNPNPYALDISGWRLDGGVRFKFKPGTVMPSNSVIYVSPDVAAFRARQVGPRGGQGLFVVGPYNGQLSAWGESLVVYDSSGRLVATNSYVGSPSAVQRFLRITEIMYHPPAFAGQPYDSEEYEYLELKNISSTVSLELQGVRLVNGVSFVFSNSWVLGPGQRVLLVKNMAAFVSRYGAEAGAMVAGQYDGYLDNGGEVLRLEDAQGEKVLEFGYNNSWYRLTDGIGFALVVVNEQAGWDQWGNKEQWRAGGEYLGSPGRENVAPAVVRPVYVNEVLAHSVWPDVDWVELYNPNGESVDVGGWYLTDDFYSPRKYRIADGVTIAAGGYLVLTEAEFNAMPGAPNNFAFSSFGDEVYLFSGDAAGNLTGWYHGYGFGASAPGVTFGRVVTSVGGEDFVAQLTGTAGAANAGPLVGPVVISEIMYHPPDVLVGTNLVDNELDEFVELQNTGSEPVALWEASSPTNVWRLRGGVDYDFPVGAVLPAGGFVLVVGFDVNDTNLVNAFRAKYGLGSGVGIYGPWRGKLNNAGETVKLEKPVLGPDGLWRDVEVERVEYKDGTPWPCGTDGTGNSLQRLAVTGFCNDPMNWVGAEATAGRATVPQAPGLATVVEAPASQVVATNSDVTFRVGVCGVPPFSFQWQRDGVDIVGETNAVLVLRNVQLSDSGLYRVGISNSAGLVYSAAGQLIVQTPPYITAQPMSVVATGYTTVMMSVGVGGVAPFNYQWTLNGTNVLGGTNGTLILTNVQGWQSGVYRVRVWNSAGSVESEGAVLTVHMPAHIVREPADVVTSNMYSATLSVDATGDGELSYQWYFNTNASYSGAVAVVGSTNVVGVQSNVLWIGRVLTNHEGYYYLVASNQYGVATSRLAGLTVVVLRIVKQPQSQTVVEGSQVSITVEFSGSTPFGYRWRTNGSGTSWVVGDLGYASLIWTNIQLSNAGTYQLVVTNAANRTGVGASNCYLTVVRPPVDKTVWAGSDAVLSAAVGSVAAYTNYFYWIGPGGEVLWEGRTNQYRVLTNVLVLGNVQLNQSGRYQFVVSNGAVGAVSYPMMLRVKPIGAPEIVSGPVGQVVVAGTNVEMRVEAAGDAPLEYQWLFNGVAVGGAVGPVLTLTNVQASDAGGYRVVVRNALDSETSAVANLVVLVPPRITNQPNDQVALAGGNATFSVGVEGTEPLYYQWWFNSTNLLGDATNATLTLTNVQAENEGQYLVIVSNAAGVATSSVASLTLAVAPQITRQPVSVEATSGETVAFTVEATGTEPLNYQWWYGETRVPGALSSTLTLSNVQPYYSGNYYVVVANMAGAVTSEVVTLSVVSAGTAPQITVQPEDVSAPAGSNAAFSVTATGSAPLVYQWWFNQTNAIAWGTNSILVLTNIGAGQAGLYHVVVSNSLGVATSRLAVLVVTHVDTDGDGMPDDWELANGLNPNDANDRQLDSDGDGLLNWQEYIAGTSPTNAQDVLKFELVGTPDGKWLLRFRAVSNHTYTIEQRLSLTSGDWQRLYDIPAVATNRMIELTNAGGARFYRVVTPQKP